MGFLLLPMKKRRKTKSSLDGVDRRKDSLFRRVNAISIASGNKFHPLFDDKVVN